jgi:hypothetical protein
MPPEIDALFDNPQLLTAVLLIGAVAGMAIQQFLSKVRRKAWRGRNIARRAANPWRGTGSWVPKLYTRPPKHPMLLISCER